MMEPTWSPWAKSPFTAGSWHRKDAADLRGGTVARASPRYAGDPDVEGFVLRLGVRRRIHDQFHQTAVVYPFPSVDAGKRYFDEHKDRRGFFNRRGWVNLRKRRPPYKLVD